MAIFWRRSRPESLAVLFNPARNEAYVTHRQAGKVSVIDAKSYKVVKTFDTPTHPNSLALSADGKTLYVSVKQKSTKQQEATQPRRCDSYCAVIDMARVKTERLAKPLSRRIRHLRQ